MIMESDELYDQRRRDIFDAYEKAIKSFGDMAKYIPKSVIIEKAMTYNAPRFYVTYEIARRAISDMIKGRSPRATGDQKSRMYNEILKRFKDSSTNTSSFTILMDILETETEGFYISKKQFSRIIYQQLKR